MEVRLIPAQSTSFNAVNQRYYKFAQNEYKWWQNLSPKWYNKFNDDVFLYKEIGKKDALDTLSAVEKFVSPGSMDYFRSCVNCVKKNL